jgi:peptidoglycan hydrolase CwlO-like protein
MRLDYWAHAHAEDPKLREQVMTDDFEEQLAEMEAQVLAAAEKGEAAGEKVDLGWLNERKKARAAESASASVAAYEPTPEQAKAAQAIEAARQRRLAARVADLKPLDKALEDEFEEVVSKRY